MSTIITCRECPYDDDPNCPDVRCDPSGIEIDGPDGKEMAVCWLMAESLDAGWLDAEIRRTSARLNRLLLLRGVAQRNQSMRTAQADIFEKAHG